MVTKDRNRNRIEKNAYYVELLKEANGVKSCNYKVDFQITMRCTPYLIEDELVKFFKKTKPSKHNLSITRYNNVRITSVVIIISISRKLISLCLLGRIKVV